VEDCRVLSLSRQSATHGGLKCKQLQGEQAVEDCRVLSLSRQSATHGGLKCKQGDRTVALCRFRDCSIWPYRSDMFYIGKIWERKKVKC
jgi:hypothetical protein